jgi:hypothetical protein
MERATLSRDGESGEEQSGREKGEQAFLHALFP